MSQPFDLDAAVAETVGEPFCFTWGGQAFSLPAVLDMDIVRQLELVNAIETLNGASPDPACLLGVIKLVMGDDLLAQMNKVRPVGAAALMQLLQKWMASQGDLGKSSVSPASSASTVRPLKPTSRSGRVRKTS